MSDPDVTSPPPDSLEVTFAEDRSRYEGHLDGRLTTVVDVDRRGDVLVVTHTGTEPEFRGQGLAGRTTEQVLADARSRGWKVDAVCPFTDHYLQTHPELADLRA
jgi:predicted GNAT family acetyltransferase